MLQLISKHIGLQYISKQGLKYHIDYAIIYLCKFIKVKEYLPIAYTCSLTQRQKEITMEKLNENDKVILIGKITEEFQYGFQARNQHFYETFIEVKRLSEVVDKIPVVVNGNLLKTKNEYVGSLVKIIGQYRSYNKNSNGKNKLILYVLVKELHFYNDNDNENVVTNNEITLNGYLCKKPIYRLTSTGKGITDILLAVNITDRESVYIPCIAWYNKGINIANMEVGQQLLVKGRIQSREYRKILSEDKTEIRTAYEVSIFYYDKIK